MHLTIYLSVSFYIFIYSYISISISLSIDRSIDRPKSLYIYIWTWTAVPGGRLQRRPPRGIALDLDYCLRSAEAAAHFRQFSRAEFTEESFMCAARPPASTQHAMCNAQDATCDMATWQRAPRPGVYSTSSSRPYASPILRMPAPHRASPCRAAYAPSHVAYSYNQRPIKPSLDALSPAACALECTPSWHSREVTRPAP